MQVTGSASQSMERNTGCFHRTHEEDGRTVGISARASMFRSSVSKYLQN
jgi:hypothetical protein